MCAQNKETLQRLVKILANYPDCVDCDKCAFRDCCGEKHTAEELIKNGVTFAKIGKWNLKSEVQQLVDDYDEELFVECPFCKRTFWVPYELDTNKICEYVSKQYPYCNCGAKLEGVSDECE